MIAERDAPWHCGQCVGGWDCAICRRLFGRPGDPPLSSEAQPLGAAGEAEAARPAQDEPPLPAKGVER
jgi:hypothetical protein